MAVPKLTVYFDTISPFAYFAYYILSRSPLFRQCEITYVPVLLGGIFKTCGNKPALQVMNKAGWIEIESKRWARAFDIPFVQSPPPGHPVSTVNVRLSTILAATLSEDAKLPSTQVQRVLVAISMCFPDKLEAAIGKFFHGYWVKWNAEPVQIPEGISRVLGELMEDAEVKKIMDMSQTPEAKKQLSQNIEHAMAEGSFGLPWFVATNAQGHRESFWGFDHLGQVINFLELVMPDEGGWRAML